MKKLLIVILVIVLILLAFFGFMKYKGWSISIGRYLEAKDGTPMFVVDDSPIRLSNQTERDLFGDLNAGDKILVVHDGIAETFPAQTGAFFVIRLSEGKAGDITQDVLDQLVELGWVDSLS